MALKRLSSHIARFIRDDAGNYAMMFAIAAPAIFGSVSVAMETSNMYRSRAVLQNALDAAALATGKHLSITVDEGELETYARDFFDANIQSKLDPSKVTFDFQFVEANTGGKRVRLTANYDYPRITGFLGSNEILMDVVSEVAAGNRTIEVAIVIDNSGSMGSYTGSTRKTRMENAKAAADTLAEQLFNLANISNKPDPVRISVVPFAASVNIGPGNRGKTWMDMNGWSSIHHENIAWDATSKRGDDWPNVTAVSSGFKGYIGGSEHAPPTSGTIAVNWLTRWTLFDALNTPWAGCVEMRPWPYHTTDAAPTSQNPETLYVPMFAPDEPYRANKSEDNDYYNDYLDEYRRAYANPLTYVYRGKHYLNTSIPGEGSNYGNYTRQNWRQDWPMKYNSDAKNNNYGDRISSNYGNYGPNIMCTTDPLTELTDNITTVENAIDAMQEGGYTNVQAGILWGWRALSPGEPFTQGRDYSALENDKYIIILTDGNNTYPDQSTYNYSHYGPWGYEKQGRIYEGINSNQSFVGAMNIHTATTCENIKAIVDGDNEAAYKIFTIAYDVPSGSSVKDLLYGCASTKADGSKYYYDVSGDALAAAMQAIGNEISDLRISQ
jgi:Flp pilus assembly protein TadG